MSWRGLLAAWLALAMWTGGMATAQTARYLVDDAVVLDATGSEGHPSAFEWYVRSPGDPDPTDPTSTDPQINLTLSKHGQWSVRLLAIYPHEAEGGGAYQSEATVTLDALYVLAALSGPTSPVDSSQDVILDGSASRVAADITPTISWTIDGPTAYGGCPDGQLTCTIPAGALGVGSYTATLEISGGGDVDSATASFEVASNEPGVDFSWSSDAADPLHLTFDGWYTPPSGVLSTAVWSFGDGSPDVVRWCPNSPDCLGGVEHTFPADGVYNVTLQVDYYDPQGASASKTHAVIAGTPPPAPTAAFTASPSSPQVMESVAFDFTGSCEGSCTYEWDFGDGSGASTQSASHGYQRSGSFPVALTVTNESGQDTASTVVQVTDCWQPSQPVVSGTRVPGATCWGDRLIATAPAGEAYLWSTGATTPELDVSRGGSYWVSVDQGSSCWGTADLSVSAQDCGDPSGDADLDGTVDSPDLTALLIELTDGDGEAVDASGGGDTPAPGADVDQDGTVTASDLLLVLGRLFAAP